MKKYILVIFIVFRVISYSFSQTNYFPSSGNVGIGLNSAPSFPFEIKNRIGPHSLLGGFFITGTNNLTAGDNNLISTGGYYNGTGLTITGSTYSAYQQVEGSHYFYGAHSLTNGNLSTVPIRMHINNTGKVGIGTSAPASLLDIRGNMTLFSGNDPLIYTGVGSEDNYRFVQLINSVETPNASGLKAGGLLIADTYSYANPSRKNAVIQGTLAIGNASLPVGYQLGVNGKILSSEIKVMNFANWPDYVFESSYQLPTLGDIERYIQENKHLQGIPSAKEVAKDGIHLGEMNAKLLQKIEELTLYMIDQNKKTEAQNEKIEQQDKLIKGLSEQLVALRQQFEK